MDVTLSLVIPAYNESRRLPPFLTSVRAHLEGRYPGCYEVIVVDDGSSDGLADLLTPLSASWPELKLIRHAENQGKGAAVRSGMLAASGSLLLFADADGAAPIREETKLAEAIAAGAHVAVGSRLAAASGVKRRRTLLRGLSGRLFAAAARGWLGIPVRDTQCGFKMFRRAAAWKLFELGRETGYLFDLELLGWAGRLGLRVVEVPIDWADVPGGHMSVARELPRVLTGLVRLRRRLRARGGSPP